MKKTLTKLLVSLLIVIILTNNCMINVAQANVMDAFAVANAAWGVVVEAIEDILGTVVGIFAIIPKIILLPLSLSVQSFMATIAYSQGTVDADGNIKNATVFNPDTWYLTPFDILFNKVALVDVDIFNIPSTPGAIKNIREAAAGWYYVMRTIAAAILLCVLIYVGIRMALSTVASDKATYKKMLVDWITSLALIFLLQYIIVFTFAVNSAFIKALASISKTNGISTAILKLYGSALFLDIDSIAATIVICMLTWQTISLLISYITRMLKVTFLVIISPLITLTYSIDKMGDGKAQALNLWLKEFVYTVLIQPFHCVIYVAFIGIAIEMLGSPIFDWDNNNIGAAVLCILCIHFTKEAEKILGKIFNFSDSTSNASLAMGMGATAILASKAGNLGKSARTIVNGAKNMKGAVNTARIEGMAIATFYNSRKDKNLEKPMTYEEAKAQATEKVNASNEARINQRAERLYNKHKASYTQEDKDKIKNIAKEMKKSNPGMTSQEALRQARIQTSRKKMENGDYKPRAIRNARGVISAISKTETAKLIPSIVAASAGVFVGAGSYGVGGDAIKSILLGSGTAKGVGEFFKTSTKRLTDENAQLLAGAGVRTVAGAKEYMGQIAGREDELKDVSKALSDVYKQITDELTRLDEREKGQVKGSIRNLVDQTLLNNPGASNADIINSLKENKVIKDAMEKSGKKIGNFTSILNQGIDLQRDSKILQNMQVPTNCGLKPEVVMDDTVRSFGSLLETSYINNGTSNTSGGNSSNGGQQGNNTSPNGGQGPSPSNSGNGGGGNGSDDNGDIPDDMEIKEDTIQSIKSMSELSPEAQQEIEEAINRKLDEYRIDIERGIPHTDAYKKVLEGDLQIAVEENRKFAQRILEDEVLIKRLTTTNEALNETIKRIQRMKG